MLRSGPALAAFFSLTIFTSAALLFFVQPMYARLVLPLLGGSAAVWTTAMLFFQSALLLGYLYAHLSTKYLPVAAQVALHLCLWATGFIFLPLAIPESWAYDAELPANLQTLYIFALGVGVPFTILAGNAPLIQSWYARSGGPSADDPYFLYGASNIGSLLALLGFPLVAAPLFGAGQISWGWAGGYLLLGALLLCSGLAARRGVVSTKNHPAKPTEKLTSRQIGAWLFFAFVPSSLMLATTETIATDIGSFPLIWVIPLSLYLLTFILAFSNRRFPSVGLLERLFLLSLIFMVLLIAFDQVARLAWISFTILIVGFFITALLAHRRLYDSRPAESHLTIFYFTMSVGGALGGVFNSIIAPSIFSDVYEGPLIIAVSSLLLLRKMRMPNSREVFVGLIAAILAVLPPLLTRITEINIDGKIPMLATGFIVAISFSLLRTRAYGLFVMAMLLATTGLLSAPTNILHSERSFFGTYKVEESTTLRTLFHGTTVHGAQLTNEDSARPSPMSYYHIDGPMGQIFQSDFGQNAETIGVVGLGVGALACYRQPHQNWTFYEIDAAVDRIARDPKLFGFMSGCAGPSPTLIGDARLVLEHQDAAYDILVIDAYSSDAVPVHLVTREALEIYRARLTNNGIIVFHISNRFFALAPVLAHAADTLGMEALMQAHPFDRSKKLAQGDVPSRVVIMARDAKTLTDFAAQERWRVLPRNDKPLWTDDYSNVLGALR